MMVCYNASERIPKGVFTQMKLTKLLALLLASTTLTACNFGQPILDEPGEDAQPPKTSVQTTATAQTTSVALTGIDCGDSGYPFPGVTGEQLDTLLQGKNNLTKAGKIQPGSVRVECDHLIANEGVENLFDGTDAQWICERKKDVLDTDSGYDIWVVFSATEAVTVNSYVLTTGYPSEDQPNLIVYYPVEWTLYGTNDPAQFTAESIYEDGWVMLDYIYDGGVIQTEGIPNGYQVDANRQGAYQYYAIKFGYLFGTRLHLSELELYTAE